ncbi:aminodeoxychorismate lyase [Kitasatospora sp. NPDC002040]|uniref:aminodeoxychorismate lyase n=1 Tax=Kitasatospora sp. NPDC002040 TaxID=3154661 RepID=UPI00331FC123
MENGTLVLLDGTVADRSRPLLRADDLGALRGDGVFEALLVVDGRPCAFAEHAARLDRSAAALGLRAPTPAAWSRCLQLALARHGPVDECYARLVLTRGPESGDHCSGYVLVDDLPASTRQARAEGVRVVTLPRGTVAPPPEPAPWLLTGAKTLSYAVNMAAQRWARSQAAEDAVFLAEDGTVLEAPTAAVLLATPDGRLLSPAPELGILPSIALATLFATATRSGWHCSFARLSLADLRAADGVWLVSSVRLAARVRSIDGTACGRSRYGQAVDLLVRGLDASAPAPPD